jgi:hypothetical protein
LARIVAAEVRSRIEVELALSRVPVLVGATAFEGRSDVGVGFVLDLTAPFAIFPEIFFLIR